MSTSDRYHNYRILPASRAPEAEDLPFAGGDDDVMHLGTLGALLAFGTLFWAGLLFLVFHFCCGVLG